MAVSSRKRRGRGDSLKILTCKAYCCSQVWKGVGTELAVLAGKIGMRGWGKLGGAASSRRMLAVKRRSKHAVIGGGVIAVRRKAGLKAWGCLCTGQDSKAKNCKAKVSKVKRNKDWLSIHGRQGRLGGKRRKGLSGWQNQRVAGRSAGRNAHKPPRS